MEHVFIQSVKVIPGAGAIKKLGALCQECGYKKPLLVFDEGIRQAGIIAKVEASLKEANIEFIEFDKVVADPPSHIVDEGAELCKKENCDCVIGVGGGSPIDTAKGINILRFNEGKILDYLTTPYKKTSGLITIPTTSGTGSELSNGAIISDLEKDTKNLILCVDNMSEYCILDPELTMGMPVGPTMMTGLDTFSHAAEAYTTTAANMMTDPICETVMRKVVEFLPLAIKDGRNLEARTQMQAAAATGGWMLYNAMAHLGHSIAHVVGANYHVIHGAACSYGFPPMIKEVANVLPQKVRKIGEILGAEFTGNETEKEIGEKTAKAYIAFRDSLGLKPIASWNINLEDPKALAKQIASEATNAFAPFEVSEEMCQRIVNEMFSL